MEDASWRVDEVVAALSQRRRGDLRAQSADTALPDMIGTVRTDSRQVEPGDLFVALRGPGVDGHDFIQGAVGSGAVAVICEVGRGGLSSAFVLEVDDTLAAYRDLAAAWRRRFDIPVVAIVGSVGKTSSKELLAALLRGRWGRDAVLATAGSCNGMAGIPETLLQIRPSHRAAVIEVGIDAPGVMQHHIAMVRPCCTMLTEVGPEHLEGLGTVEKACEEEFLALQLTTSYGGKVFVKDQALQVAPAAVVANANHWTRFSLLEANTTVSETVTSELVGAWDAQRGTLTIRCGAPRQQVPEELLGQTFVNPLEGRHQAGNLLGAIGVAASLGVRTVEMQRGLAREFAPPPGRGELRRTDRGVRVWCDHYNANPTSMLASFLTVRQRRDFSKASSPGELWVCLGDMLELGALEHRYHEALAEPLLAMEPQHVWLVGSRMRWLYQRLSHCNHHSQVRHFDDVEDMAVALAAAVQPNDWVLLKASRSIRIERVISHL